MLEFSARCNGNSTSRPPTILAENNHGELLLHIFGFRSAHQVSRGQPGGALELCWTTTRQAMPKSPSGKSRAAIPLLPPLSEPCSCHYGSPRSRSLPLRRTTHPQLHVFPHPPAPLVRDNPAIFRAIGGLILRASVWNIWIFAQVAFQLL